MQDMGGGSEGMSFMDITGGLGNIFGTSGSTSGTGTSTGTTLTDEEKLAKTIATTLNTGTSTTTGTSTGTSTSSNAGESVTSGGRGDVSFLAPIITEMSKSASPEGMQALIQSIFKSGFEQQMPTLLSNANTSGIRPQDSTTVALMTNDLVARLTGQAASAVGAQQERTANAAGKYADVTKSDVVTKTSGGTTNTTLGTTTEDKQTQDIIKAITDALTTVKGKKKEDASNTAAGTTGTGGLVDNMGIKDLVSAATFGIL